MEEENKKEEVQEEVKEPIVEEAHEVKEEVSTTVEQNPKKNNKMLFVIIAIALLIIGLCVGFIVGNGFTNKDGKEKGNEQENNNGQNNEIKIDNDYINKLYYKYHSSDTNVVGLASSMVIEAVIYLDDTNEFYIKDLEKLPASYSKKLFMMSKDELGIQDWPDEGEEDDKILLSKAEPVIKKNFNKFFGNNLEYKRSLFNDGCSGFRYSDNSEYATYGSGCGDIYARSANYKLTKYEKVDDKIYIYEDVRLSGGGIDDEDLEFKWIYTKGDDGEYYLYKIEKNSSETGENTGTEKDGLEYIDLKVKNINSSKDYHIQLVKKYEESDSEYDDGYRYAYYDKDSKKFISDFYYTNGGCNVNDCSKDDSDSCVEKDTKISSFKVKDKDYLYVYVVNVNICEGYEAVSFIYNISDGKYIIGSYGERSNYSNYSDEVITDGDEAIIKINRSNPGICGGWANGCSCRGGGFVFSNGGNFKEVRGFDVLVTEDKKYVVVSSSDDGQTCEKDLVLNIYDRTGKITKSYDNVVSYNDKYMVTYSENTLFIYDLSYRQLGTIDFEEYNSNCFFNPDLTIENNKLVIEYYLNDGNDINYNTSKKYFDLKN